MQIPAVQAIEADVLVVGAGLAGCWAALGAKEYVGRVVLVDKAIVGKSGASTFASGVMLAPLPEDDLDDWLKEIVENGEYMSDQYWVMALLNEQMSRIAQMESWGFAFERDADGRLARTVGRGHRKTKVLMFHGPKLMEGMRKKVLAKNIRLIERVMVTDLIAGDQFPSNHGQVSGAIGFHPRTGEWMIFQANSVVLSCGQIGIRIGGDCVDNLSGDGVAMAYRAGAVLSDMEFGTNCNIRFWQRRFAGGGINMFQGYGACFVNAKGERFMAKYDPVLKERARTCVLGPAFAKETLEGRGPIYMDLRHLKPEIFEKFNRVIPHSMRIFREGGIDPMRELIQCDISAQSPRSDSGQCGIRVGLDCQTSIPGLFAAGANTKILPHGTFAVGGLNLAYCCVSGYRAGREAGRLVSEGAKDRAPYSSAVSDYIDKITEGSTRSTLDLDQVQREIKLATIPARFSFFKHQRRINQTLRRLEEIEKDILSQKASQDTHDQVKSLEIRNYLTCAKLSYKAALLREESRGSHFREEFPYRDNYSWLKWLMVRKVGEEDEFGLVAIPIDKYPVKPEEPMRTAYPVQYYFEEI